jgi:protein TonB
MLRHIVAVAAIIMLTASMSVAQDKAAAGKEKPARKIEKGMTEPVLVQKVDPTYPVGAKADKIQGSVKLNAKIETTGEVVDITVAESPDPRLSEAAIQAVKQWKFTPGKDKAGKPVKAMTTLTINFRLK